MSVSSLGGCSISSGVSSVGSSLHGGGGGGGGDNQMMNCGDGTCEDDDDHDEEFVNIETGIFKSLIVNLSGKNLNNSS